MWCVSYRFALGRVRRCRWPTTRLQSVRAPRRASSEFTGLTSAVISGVRAWEWEWLSPWNGTRHNTTRAMCRADCACVLLILRRYQHAWLRRAPFLLPQEAEGRASTGRLREEQAAGSVRSKERIGVLVAGWRLSCGRRSRKQDQAWAGKNSLCRSTALVSMRVGWRQRFVKNGLLYNILN